MNTITEKSDAEKIINTREPEVYLIDTTKKPFMTCKTLIDIMTKDIDIEYDDDKEPYYNGLLSKDQIEHDIASYALEPHGSVFEAIQTVWVIKNVSRAFQQQLTRTRLAGYSCASLRVIDVGKFADEGRYTMPVGLDELQKDYFHLEMKEIQNAYNRFINNSKMPIEAARGILPLNIHSNVGFIINFQSLRHMISIRLCHTTQGEFRKVAMLMKERIKETLGETFSNLLVAPCEKDHICRRSEHYCGRWSNKDENELTNKKD